MKKTFEAVESAFCTQTIQYFATLVDQVRDADIFHQGTKVAAAGSLFTKGWDLLKNPLVGPWGVFPGNFYLKYSLGISHINLNSKPHLKINETVTTQTGLRLAPTLSLLCERTNQSNLNISI